MTQEKQQELLEESLRAFLNSKVSEYDLTYASIIGVLGVIQADYVLELQKEREKNQQ